jgi:hypothetical protein
MTVERGRFDRILQSARELRMALLGLAFLAGVSVAASAQTYIEFSVPGGGEPTGVNASGVIIGDASGKGFVGTANGTFTTFDVPGANGTAANSINSAGVIAGLWTDANAVRHGFVRASNGTTTKFDDPDANENISSKGTFPESINAAGEIAGYCTCSGFQGFVRSASGTITNFTVPDASGTYALSINTGGAIAGYYYDESGTNGTTYVFHGYVRSADDTITSFDAPGAGSAESTGFVEAQGTFARSINASGEVVGYYIDEHFGYHGFIRSADGTITTIDAPGAGSGTDPGTGDSLGTKLLGVNDNGIIIGTYLDANEVAHGFMVSASGDITNLNAPGASGGTIPASINDGGVIVGYFVESGGGVEGFQFTP